MHFTVAMFSQVGRIAVKGVEGGGGCEGGELADVALRLGERVGREQERYREGSLCLSTCQELEGLC